MRLLRLLRRLQLLVCQAVGRNLLRFDLEAELVSLPGMVGIHQMVYANVQVVEFQLVVLFEQRQILILEITGGVFKRGLCVC